MASKYDCYSLSHCTHELQCGDGPSGRQYLMPCVVLHKMGKTSVRVLVFGDRNGNNQGHRKMMRLVPLNRVQPKEK